MGWMMIVMGGWMKARRGGGVIRGRQGGARWGGRFVWGGWLGAR